MAFNNHHKNKPDESVFWKRPHPFIFNTSSILIPGLLSFVVILVLAPFSYSSLDLKNRMIQALISAFIVSGTVWLMVRGMKRILPNWTKPDSWNIGKEMLLFISILTTIALFHFVLFWFRNSNASLFQLFQQVVLRTLAISLFPIIGLVLFEQHHHRTKQLKKALRLIKLLQHYKEQEPIRRSGISSSEKMIWFTGENGKPVCQLDPDIIQFIKSEGNYFEVHHLDKDEANLKKKLVRNKLAQAESLLKRNHFWRVHRSYLVNLNQVETVSGNARDLELIMKVSNKRIPVSRSKVNELLKEVAQLSH